MYYWVPGVVMEIDKTTGSIKPDYPDVENDDEDDDSDSEDVRRKKKKNKKVKLKGPKTVDIQNVLPRDPNINEDTVITNLITIDNINEGNVLEALRLRFDVEDCCIYCAGVLLYINPYQRLEEFGVEQKLRYFKRLVNPYYEMNNVPPHLYSLVVDGLHPLVHSKTYYARSFVFVGESASGKTESFNYALDFIMYTFSDEGLRNTSNSPSSLTGKPVSLNAFLSQSNRVLNYLSTAITPKNTQSSRFSKLLTIFVRDNRIAGMKYKYFFLEKNRLIKHSRGETVFHIFRLAHHGLSEEQKKKYGIAEDMSVYPILKQSLDLDTSLKYLAHWKLFQDAWLVCTSS